MKWLRAPMRKHIADGCAIYPTKNVLSFRDQAYSEENSTKTTPGTRALDLVCQAAEIIRNNDDYASEKQARAETLAKQAIEELKIAHARVRSAESERRAAEAEIKELSVRVQEVEKAMERATSHVAAAETQLAAAEQRTRTSEMRANEAENALRRIEEAIRTRILGKIPGGSRRAVTAA
jgi:chromosome segregation ATPase